MLKTIEPSGLSGTILAPASKSSMQRACAAALLRIGETAIHHPGYSNDDKAALGVIRDLGAEVQTMEDGSLRVQSKGVKSVAAEKGALEVNCGESGLGLRMFAPIMGLSNQVIKVRGKLPLEIQGPLTPRDITIDGSLSSQFLTGLLLSFAAAGAKGVTIKVNNLKSKPYIDLTLAVMKHFGWEVENRNYAEFYFPAVGGLSRAGDGVSARETVEYTVEGDWSGGAFLLVAGALAGPITVKGLDVRSTQADKAMVQALGASGAKLAFKDDEIVVGPGTLKAFPFDATECPDLFPPLVALAAYCEGTTVIQGVSRLAHKESDRGLTLRDEFGKMGLSIGLDGDRMLIHGGGGLKGTTVHSRHDHRIAMACAVAALKAGSPVTIEEAEAINKSYPDFYEDLKKLGGQL
jgi:3-phosphoshikimate 1-carboxyvinyltransferase